jgi:hypothetical protein
MKLLWENFMRKLGVVNVVKATSCVKLAAAHLFYPHAVFGSKSAKRIAGEIIHDIIQDSATVSEFEKGVQDTVKKAEETVTAREPVSVSAAGSQVQQPDEMKVAEIVKDVLGGAIEGYKKVLGYKKKALRWDKNHALESRRYWLVGKPDLLFEFPEMDIVAELKSGNYKLNLEHILQTKAYVMMRTEELEGKKPVVGELFYKNTSVPVCLEPGDGEMIADFCYKVRKLGSDINEFNDFRLEKNQCLNMDCEMIGHCYREETQLLELLNKGKISLA